MSPRLAFRCDLCGGARAAKLGEWIVRCEGCGLTATYPQPEPSVLQRRYGEDYYSGWDGGGGRARMWAARVSLARRWLAPGRLLDVGCGSGEFLRAARAAGWEAAGTEFSDAARGAIKDFDVAKRPSEASGLFDAATMWHVLEHVPSPVAALEEVRAKLKPGARLLLAVPNVDSHWFDLVYRCVKLKRNELYTPQTKEPHLFHFSMSTLRRCLEAASFKVLWQGLDAPDHSDARKLVVDWPARAAFRLTGVNWATTQAAVAERP